MHGQLGSSGLSAADYCLLEFSRVCRETSYFADTEHRARERLFASDSGVGTGGRGLRSPQCHAPSHLKIRDHGSGVGPCRLGLTEKG